MSIWSSVLVFFISVRPVDQHIRIQADPALWISSDLTVGFARTAALVGTVKTPPRLPHACSGLSRMYRFGGSARWCMRGATLERDWLSGGGLAQL